VLHTHEVSRRHQAQFLSIAFRSFEGVAFSFEVQIIASLLLTASSVALEVGSSQVPQLGDGLRVQQGSALCSCPIPVTASSQVAHCDSLVPFWNILAVRLLVPALFQG